MEHADDARRSLVATPLQVEAGKHVGIGGGTDELHGAAVRDIGEKRAEREHERRAEVLGDTDDLVGYAQQLYDLLRRADDEGRSAVVAVMPPAAGLGHAIRDRLLKASADRAG